MSHTMNIQASLKDMAIVELVCQKLGVKISEVKDHKLFNTTERGRAIQLEGWRYPMVIKEDGSVAFDNYNGSLGKTELMSEFRAHYGIEAAKSAARKAGYSYYETVEENGDLKLTIDV